MSYGTGRAWFTRALLRDLRHPFGSEVVTLLSAVVSLKEGSRPSISNCCVWRTGAAGSCYATSSDGYLHQWKRTAMTTAILE